MFKKILSLVLVVVMCLSLSAMFGSCTQNGGSEVEKTRKDKGILDTFTASPISDAAKAELKIGFIFLHDENSTYDKNFMDAARRAQAELGLTNDQVLFEVGIPETAECYEAAKRLVAKGCQVVFADSFGHESFMIQAAKEYPNVQFCHATGTQAHTANLANFHNAFASIYEGRYVAGIVAGMKLNEMIASGKITADKAKMGYVGAFPYAEVKSGYTSFYLGAKSVCPSVTMEVRYTNSWYDESKEKETAVALIGSGCVLISQHADSMGAPTACEEAKVPNVSYNGSTTTACPNTALISSYIDWAPYFLYMIGCVANNQEIHDDFCGGFAAGSVKMTALNTAVAAEGTQAAIDAAIAQFKAGTLKVFDVEKDNYITVGGKKLTEYAADVDSDEAYAKDTHVVWDGAFLESYFRSAPYFDIVIDGITANEG